jgi:hypothetical protein
MAREILNLKSVPERSPYYTRLLDKLNEQENTIERLQAEIETHQKIRDKEQAEREETTSAIGRAVVTVGGLNEIAASQGRGRSISVSLIAAAGRPREPFNYEGVSTAIGSGTGNIPEG